MENNEVLLEVIESLKLQNKELARQLKEKPKPWLGLSDMWAAFWSTVGGVWKDFWSAISTMWCAIWKDEAATVGFVFIVIAGIIATGIVSYEAVSGPEPVKPLVKLTNRFSLTSSMHTLERGCFFIVQEKTNGATVRVSPCIKDETAALKTLKEIKSLLSVDVKADNLNER